MLFAHEALYNADTGNILLNAGIEVVVPRENLVEHLGSLGNDDSKNGSQNHHRAEEYQADAHVNEHTHYNAAYEHDRSSYSNAYYHLERVLEIGDVGGHTCNETGGAELIYVRERELLDIGEHCVTEITCESRGSVRSELAGEYAECKAHERHDEHNAAVNVHLGYISGVNAFVDYSRRDERDKYLHHDFQHCK